MRHPGWRAATAALLLAGLVGCAAPVPEPAAASVPGAVSAAPTPAAPAPAARAAGPLRVLQLNLCNSGIAACYSGRSIAAAAALLRAEAPDLVTLNEVCGDDVPVLERALAGAVPGGGVFSAFQPARDGQTGRPYRCRNGQEYGVGLVSRWPAAPGPANAGIYPAQDPDDPEQRAWLCHDVAAPAPFAACTTHLAYTRRAVTAAQCRHLFGTVVAGLRARDGAGPVVVAADLNLDADDAELRDCVPPGAARADDRGPQHVVATGGLAVDDRRLIDLRGVTDHPGLLVRLVAG